MASGHFRPPPEVGGSSYFPSSNSYLMSDGLQRARRPYRQRNLIVGAGIAGFVGLTYFYVTKSLQQEDFSDVQSVPQDVRKRTKSIEDKEAEEKASLVSSSLISSHPDSLSPSPPSQESSPAPSSNSSSPFWSSLAASGFKGKDAPSSFITRAPSLDNIGKVGDRSSDHSSRRLV